MNLARIPQAANCYKWVCGTTRESKATVPRDRIEIRYNDVVCCRHSSVLQLKKERGARAMLTDVGAAVPGTEFCSRLDTCEIFLLPPNNAPQTRSGTMQSVLDTTRYQYHTSLSTRFILVVAYSAVHSYSCTRTSNTSCGQCLSRRQSGEQEQVQKAAGRAGQARA